jgi:hypothetical protein
MIWRVPCGKLWIKVKDNRPSRLVSLIAGFRRIPCIKIAHSPSPRRAVRLAYHVLNTISSSVTSDITAQGVLSIYSPRVNTFPSLRPRTLKGRTSLSRASAASWPHSDFRNDSFSLRGFLVQEVNDGSAHGVAGGCGGKLPFEDFG